MYSVCVELKRKRGLECVLEIHLSQREAAVFEEARGVACWASMRTDVYLEELDM